MSSMRNNAKARKLTAKERFTDEDLEEIQSAFTQYDADKNGHITTKELGACFEALGENVPGYKLREMIDMIDNDRNGMIEFDEFLEMYCSVTTRGVFGQWSGLVSKKEGTKEMAGTESSAEGTKHSTSDAEVNAFTDWINNQLNHDADCKKYLPITPSTLMNCLKDGIILCKMINLSAPKTIDERAINKNTSSTFKIQENNDLVLNSARAIGCTVVNIRPSDIESGKVHLCLGLLWQIIRIGLFANISLQSHPNLAVLLEEGETIEQLMALPPETLLLRFVNYHLKKAGSHKRIYNFSSDIKDSEAYAILLKQIAPEERGVDRPERVTTVGDLNKRAELVLENADKIGCRRFVTPKDITSGNAKLNLAFVANLFNNYPALDPADIEEEVEYEPYEESREEKTYRNWMNSLGVNPFVYHLYNDISDGHVLFQLFDAIKKGTVDWNKVNKPPFKLAAGGTMKKIENCNLAVTYGKGNNYSLVGIGGEDIYNNNKTLVLALVWQMLRHYTMQVLGKIHKTDGSSVTDSAIVDWVNKKLAESGKESKITSFKDSNLSTSLAVIDLVDAIKPGSIDYDLVTPGVTAEDKELNAQYAISLSRKIGAMTYGLPEDLVEVKPKMILTIFACLMTLDLSNST